MGVTLKWLTNLRFSIESPHRAQGGRKERKKSSWSCTWYQAKSRGNEANNSRWFNKGCCQLQIFGSWLCKGGRKSIAVSVSSSCRFTPYVFWPYSTFILNLIILSSFKFTQLDAGEPLRPFSFVLDINDEDSYVLEDCQPPIDDITLSPLLDELNESNDLSPFLRAMSE